MKKLIFLIFPLFISAQDVGIGHWKDYLSYNSASYICEANEKIYCVASGGLYYLNKEDMTINRMSKIIGLSDIGVKQIAYSTSLDVTVITYENCNIDLIKNNQIVNISDIKRKEIAGLKTINNITINSGTAYLSSSFGLVLVDLEKEEIKDTYNIGDLDGNFEIKGCAFVGDSIIAATSEGVFYANSNSLTLSDYNNWNVITGNSNEETYDNVIDVNGEIEGDYFFEVISISYNNQNLIKTNADSSISIINDDGTTYKLMHSKFENIKYAWNDNDNIVWVADSINGLLKFKNFEYVESYIPEAAVENQIYSLEFINDKLYVCHGGKEFETPPGNKNGASIMNSYDSWRNYDFYEFKQARDIIEVTALGNKTYFASYYNGVIELENNEVVEKYSWHNTANGLDTISYWQSDNRMAISDLKFDEYGNMWGLLSSVDNPLFVKTKENEWLNFSISSTQNFLFDELLIDSYNQKWGIMERGNGIFVYNDNNTLDNTNDDQYKLLSTNIGNGNLPSMNIYCIANDLDGEIWIGSNNGISVFYNPEAVFSGYDFDAQQILITEGQYGQYLLSEEKVNCITIDGANRKWVGTEKSGVFLFSEDGVQEIHHFTKDNSPLFSDNITDIAINHENGEVFIGTAKGLISYRSDATEGVVIQNNTKVFPNPVKETYNGPIAISGLASNVNVKITDASGNLVFETTANGGQAIWNGLNKNGERASTGVYLVFSTDLYGEQKVVSKILYIH